jgi:hypothetical protein
MNRVLINGMIFNQTRGIIYEQMALTNLCYDKPGKNRINEDMPV